jgi:hypothetical protein
MAQDLPQPSAKTSNSDSTEKSTVDIGAMAIDQFKQILPGFDPRSDTVVWNGGAWKITNNRLIRSQFIKYLNTPAEMDETSLAYGEILAQIQRILTPTVSGRIDLDAAWRLLFEASNLQADNHFCKDIADSVYAVWQTKKEQHHLTLANESIQKKEETLRWNMAMEVEGDSTLFSSRDSGANRAKDEERQIKRGIRLKPYESQLAELELTKKANSLKKETSEVEARMQLQTLIVQLFFQRRFEHVIIACRFYQVLFGDGDQKLLISGQAKALLSGAAGMDPTISVITVLTHESIQNVNNGVSSYLFLMKKGELEAATERLQEAYMLGEHLPAVKKLSRDDKRMGYEYMQKADMLMDSLEVKDYDRARKLVEEMGKLASDFNPTKPLAAIQTATTLSKMHLAKAKAAASQKDSVTLEAELKAAVEIWPRNPELEKVSSNIFNQADLQQQALSVLERLIAEKNYRQIFEDRAKFIAATAMVPERAKELEKILTDMQTLELSLAQANKIAELGDYRGAWECLELVKNTLPNDNKLNENRLNYATRVPGFVSALSTAEEKQKSGDLGASLSWYLKAYAEYPSSQLAAQGIQKVVNELLSNAVASPTAALAVDKKP